MSAEASSSGEAEARPLPSGAARWASASSAVSVPDSASTWCAESTVPSASCGLVLGQQPLEAEQQRELAPPGRRGVLRLRVGVELCERLVERAPARGAGRERDGGVLAVVQETLAHELLRARDFGGTWNGRGREGH